MRFLVGPPQNFCAIFSEDQEPPLAKHNCLCQSMWSMFRVLGLYNFAGTLPNFLTFCRLLSTDALLGRPPDNFCAIFSDDQGPPLAKHNQFFTSNIRSMFRVLGRYNFAGTLPNFWTFHRYYQRMRFLVGPQKIFVQFSQKTKGHLWQNTMEAK